MGTKGMMRWAELVAMRCERVVENTWGLYPTVQLLLWINSSSLHSWKERKLWRMRRRPCSSASSGSPIFIFCIALTRPVSWDLYWTEINQKERVNINPQFYAVLSSPVLWDSWLLFSLYFMGCNLPTVFFVQRWSSWLTFAICKLGKEWYWH